MKIMSTLIRNQNETKLGNELKEIISRLSNHVESIKEMHFSKIHLIVHILPKNNLHQITFISH